MSDNTNVVAVLLAHAAKIANTGDGNEVMKYTQAAVNAANALQVLQDIRRNEPPEAGNPASE